MVGIDPDMGDTASIMSQFIAQTGVTFPMGWDFTGTYMQFRNAGGTSISPYPLDVVIDTDGTVAYINREYGAAEMQAVIEGLLQ